MATETLPIQSNPNELNLPIESNYLEIESSSRSRSSTKKPYKRKTLELGFGWNSPKPLPGTAAIAAPL
jgi:hypothetical protein